VTDRAGAYSCRRSRNYAFEASGLPVPLCCERTRSRDNPLAPFSASTRSLMLLECKSRSSTDSTLLMTLPPCQQRTAQRQAARAQRAGDRPSLNKGDLGVEDYAVAVHFHDDRVSVCPLFDLEAQVRCVLHTHQRHCEHPPRRGRRRAGAKPRAQCTQATARASSSRRSIFKSGTPSSIRFQRRWR
jgi:hypothetical protein